MSATSTTWHRLERGDTTIEHCSWAGIEDPRGAVLIVHGAGEHAARYARFASKLVDHGLVVHGIDLRGHGRTAAEHGIPGVARPGGWSAMIDDIVALTDVIAAAQAGMPIVLFGHSMGSFLARGVIQTAGDRYAGVVLSGTGAAIADADELIAMTTAVEDAEGPEAPSQLFAGMFAGFNEDFAATVENPTGFEWLSRDRAEVQAYVDDPWCGGDLSNGFVSDMLAAMAQLAEPGAISSIPDGLPILLIAGDADPVGDQGAAVRALGDDYVAAGKGPVTTRLYPDARHELLNETNRTEVEDFLINWILDVLAG